MERHEIELTAQNSKILYSRTEIETALNLIK